MFKVTDKLYDINLKLGITKEPLEKTEAAIKNGKSR